MKEGQMRSLRRSLCCILTASALVLSALSGCGSQDATENVYVQSETTESAAEASSAETTEDKTPSENTEEEPAQDQAAEPGDEAEETDDMIPQLRVEQKQVPHTAGIDFVRSLRIGWNLGNTFDAYGDWYKGDELGTETIWQPDRTSSELIHELHEAGFSTIRIPVTWHGHFTDDDYTISDAWMERVAEVVGWALDEGMYVILNIHHDNDPEAGCLYPDAAHREQSLHYIDRIWTQVAARFRDAGDHLIFESMNEPRLVGTDVEWTYLEDDARCIEAADIINEMNQLFVDTVRSSGGENATRWLTCPGYAASVDGVTTASYVRPTDMVDRVMVTTHAYTPYSFALDKNGTAQLNITDQSQTEDLDRILDALYERYTSQGIPVVMDEFGAMNKDGNLQDRVDFTAYYIAQARARGITCCWWDNNAYEGDGELFGLIRRGSLEWVTPEIVKAMMTYCDGGASAGLAGLYDGRFRIGVAVQAIDHWNDPTAEIGNASKEALICQEFNSITFGNEFKPAYNFDPTSPTLFKVDPAAEELLDWARDNDMPVRGHTLVWHSQVDPSIFAVDYKATADGKATKDYNAKLDESCLVDRQTLLARLRTYIRGVLEYTYAEGYADTIYAWDVLNEASDENEEDGMRRSYWYQIIGPDFVYYCFLYAREAVRDFSAQYADVYGLDPAGDLSTIQPKLYYNDYNEWFPRRVQAISGFLSGLSTQEGHSAAVEAGLVSGGDGTVTGDGLIDGIGLQGHLEDTQDINAYISALEKYAGLVSEVQVTELDIGATGSGEDKWNRQALCYYELFSRLVEARESGINLTAVTLWGLTDDASWRRGADPLLFDQSLSQKSAYAAVAAAGRGINFEAELKARGEGSTDELVIDFEPVVGKFLTTNALGIRSRGAGHQSALKIGNFENHTENAAVGNSLRVTREARDATVQIDLSDYIGVSVQVVLYVKTEDARIMAGIEGSEVIGQTEVAASGDWTEVSLQADIPKSWPSAQLFVETDGQADYYIDDIRVTPVK